jgi:DNA polymerase delta subunit 2
VSLSYSLPQKVLTQSRGDSFIAPERLPSPYVSLDTFKLPKGSEKKYSTQYADLYFVRLALLKRTVEQVAEEAWGGFEVCNVLNVVG